MDGVSLTVNQVDGCGSINLIPHTVQGATLRRLTTGSKVNLEIDLMARYCDACSAWTAARVERNQPHLRRLESAHQAQAHQRQGR